MKEIVATNDVAARRMMSSAFQHVEFAKALPARIGLMMKSLERLTHEELQQIFSC